MPKVGRGGRRRENARKGGRRRGGGKVCQRRGAVPAKGKVRGRGCEERRQRTGVCRARSVGRGARDRGAVLGARVRRGPGSGSGSVGSRSGRGVLGPGGAAVPAAETARRPRGEVARGRLCTPRAPGAALGRICTLPREAGSPAWRWPSAGASSGHRGLGGLATRGTGPLFPLLSRAGLPDGRARHGAERRRGGWGGGRGHRGQGF